MAKKLWNLVAPYRAAEGQVQLVLFDDKVTNGMYTLDKVEVVVRARKVENVDGETFVSIDDDDIEEIQFVKGDGDQVEWIKEALEVVERKVVYLDFDFTIALCEHSSYLIFFNEDNLFESVTLYVGGKGGEEVVFNEEKVKQYILGGPERISLLNKLLRHKNVRIASSRGVDDAGHDDIFTTLCWILSEEAIPYNHDPKYNMQREFVEQQMKLSVVVKNYNDSKHAGKYRNKAYAIADGLYDPA